MSHRLRRPGPWARGWALVLLVTPWGHALAQAPDAAPPAEAQTPADVEAPSGLESLESLLEDARDSSREVLGQVSAASQHDEVRLKAPATMTVLNADDIEASGAMSIADLLRRVPGVLVFYNAPGNYVVSLRGTAGLQGNQVVVLMDDVPLNSPVDGRVDWSGLPVALEDLERIEIVRGPVSTIYGANAYTGVIKLITKRPSEESLRSAATLAAGADETAAALLHAHGAASATAGPLSWRVSAAATRQSAFSEAPSGPYTNAGERHPALTSVKARAAALYHPDAHSEVHLDLGGALTAHSQLEHLALEPQPERRREAFAELSWQSSALPLFAGIVDTLKLWSNGRWLSLDDEGATVLGFGYGGLRSFEAAAGADTELRLGGGVTATLGANAGSTYADAPFIHPAESGRWRPDYGVHLGVSADLADAVVLDAAVRADDSALLRKTQYSYRASAIFYGSLWSGRVTAASAYRSPTYVEVAGRFIDPQTQLILLEGEPTVAPPRVDSVEASLLLEHGDLSLNPVVYAAILRHTMVEDFEPLVRKSFRNDPRRRLYYGGELQLGWRLDAATRLEATLAVVLRRPLTEADAAALALPLDDVGYTAWLGMRRVLFEERLRAALGASLTRGYAYNTRTGIPPSLLDVELATTVWLDGSMTYKGARSWPVALWIKGQAFLPHGGVASPLPGAARQGAMLVVGLSYAEES